MHRNKFLCKITDQDDNVYMVRRRDLHHFIRWLNRKHCSAQLPATSSGKETTLYMSRKVQLAINLCTILHPTFMYFILPPMIFAVVELVPCVDDRWLSYMLAFCGAYLSYEIKTLVACFIVSHMHWLTRKPGVDSADFLFQVEQNRNAGKCFVWPVIILESIAFLAIYWKFLFPQIAITS